MNPINQLIRAIMEKDSEKYEKMMDRLGIVLKGGPSGTCSDPVIEAVPSRSCRLLMDAVGLAQTRPGSLEMELIQQILHLHVLKRAKIRRV